MRECGVELHYSGPLAVDEGEEVETLLVAAVRTGESRMYIKVALLLCRQQESLHHLPQTGLQVSIKEYLPKVTCRFPQQ